MGITCPCGVKVNAIANGVNVKFRWIMGDVKGNLHYVADVCVATLSTSTLSLQFTDTNPSCRHSFLFTATSFTSVTCKQEGMNCIVTVKGKGTVNGRNYPFEAIFRDQVASAANDIVQKFKIAGFFDQTGAVPVPQGSIIDLGCQEL
ncbi:hypothetical protein [Solibacillus sp. CAU 1738]|uniref:hypothetical protein n=1 Tax=Solibacillus sp. CAU 1738 TaxID=3140363 RepID=UPI003260A9C5